MQIYFLNGDGFPVKVHPGAALIMYDDDAEPTVNDVMNAGDDTRASVTDIHEALTWQDDDPTLEPTEVTVDLAFAKRFNMIRNDMLRDPDFLECEWLLGDNVTLKLVNE